MSKSDDFKVEDTVRVHTSNHSQNGKVGTIMYYGHFLGTWIVKIDGEQYGFLANELIKEAKHD